MTDWVGAALGMDEPSAPKVTPAAVDWVGAVTGVEQPSPQAPQTTKAQAEPDAPTWVGRRVQDIRGKRDPRMAGAPTIAEVLLKEGGHSVGSEAWSWLTGASDNDMAVVYRGMLGNRFIREEADANNYPVIVYKGQDGKEARAYVNKPGFDVQDAVRGVYGALPFVATGGMAGSAMRGASLIPRMAGQAATMGATSVAQDAAGVVSGVSDLDLEKTGAKAGMAALGGAGGELLGSAGSALWRRYVTEPRYFNRATGQLTAEGEAAVKAAGLDPADIPGDMARTFAREMTKAGGDVGPTEVIRSAASNKFGIPRTKGELTGNQQQLLREQQMVGGTYGEQARQGMQAFRDRQKSAVDFTARSAIPEEIAPGSTSTTPATAGFNIRSNTVQAYNAAKAAENEAWKKVPTIEATDEALGILKDSINKALGDRIITSTPGTSTPAAANMIGLLTDFMEGKAPQQAADWLSKGATRNVDQTRRHLLRMMDDATTPGDVSASRAIYNGYNEWIGEAAKRIGDPQAATALVTARGISREVHEAFKGPAKSGADRILAKVLNDANSAEEIVNALFSSPSKAQIKNGAVPALDSLKKAYDKYLSPEAAKAAWDDIKLAYWVKTTTKPTGEVMEPAMLSSALKTAANSQNTVWLTLYSPQERATFRMLASVLDDVKRRNPNTSWSAIGVGQLAKDIGDAVLTMIGGNSIIGRSAARWVAKPFSAEYGAAQLRGAVGRTGQGASLPARPPPPISGLGGAAGAQSQR